MSDSRDVALAIAGDYEAFERLYRRYLGRIYSLCARLSASRKRGTALTEELFVKAWDDLPHFGGETPFAVWLHRLATDVVLSRERIRVGNPTVSQPSRSVSETSNHRSVVRRSRDLAEAIDELEPAARGIFVLHDVEGYDYREIAEIFGITVGASKARLQQARVLLKEAMGR